MNALRGKLALGLLALTVLVLMAALLLVAPASSRPAPAPAVVSPPTPAAPAPARGRIVLSFDDYPFPDSSPQLLQVLAELRVPATFFCVGDKLEVHPEFAAQALYLGHELENHTYNHQRLTTCTRAQINRELRLCSRVIESLTGSTPRFLRSPGGRSTAAIRREAAACGLECVDPWVRSIKDLGRTRGQIVDQCLRSARDGVILSLHDGLPQTSEALRMVVPTLRARGYEFVRLDELLPARPAGDPRGTSSPAQTLY